MGKRYETYDKVASLLMRTPEQIAKIKLTESAPFSFNGLLSNADVENLLAYYFLHQDSVIKKSTGPSVLKLDNNSPVLVNIVKQLSNVIGNFEIRYAHFFDVTDPHIIHNDDTFDYPNCFKAFTIPLKIYGDLNDIHLVVFDQHYYGGPAKFVAGEDTSTYNIHYNTLLTNYIDVDGLNNNGVNPEIFDKYLTHLRPEWVTGLSINKMLSWTVGSVLSFDSLALHCSTEFRNIGVERKIGLSIFTVI